jgi:hypothetical protein
MDGDGIGSGIGREGRRRGCPEGKIRYSTSRVGSMLLIATMAN